MACTVKVNRHGNLFFRLYWNGRESWEGTKWKDTPKNRQRALARAVLMSEEMEQGTFEYLKWFPEGNKADQFRPRLGKPLETKSLTVKEFYESWIEKKKPPFVRRSLERDYRQAFNKHVLRFMGDVDLNGVTLDTLENFRLYLVEECKLTLKTARNII